MNNNYGGVRDNNVTAGVGMQEAQDGYLKTVDKQDLKNALLFLMGLGDGIIHKATPP